MVLQRRKLPPPSAGEVRVKVLAAGIGYADVMARRGEYILQRSRPFTPGYELIGEVVDWHTDIPNLPKWLQSGQRIAASLPKMAAYTEMIALPLERLVPIPDSTDIAVAAAIPLNYLTAVSLLERHSHLEKGDAVLIHGASGAVGEALCQLGKLKRLTMYGTASAKHRERLEAYGVHFIDYASQDFEKIIKDLEPNGISAVFDPIGGVYINKSYRLLKRGGVLVSYAFAGSPGKIMSESLKGSFSNLLKRLIPDGKRTDFCSEPEEVKKDIPWYQHTLKTLFEQVEQGKITPTVSKVFPLKDAGEAQEFMAHREKPGKVVLVT